MIEKLKNRWGVHSNLSLILILVVFSVTGLTAVYIKDLIFQLIGIDSETPFYLRFILYIFILFPAYQVFLYIYAAILGQLSFFKKIQQRTFQRINFFKKKGHK